MDTQLETLAHKVGERLARLGLSMAVAESCTGGWICKAMTDIPGSSGCFDRGFITYSNEAKQELLGVSAATLQAHGAVSEATVREMVQGALENSRASVAVAVSGIAGPSGGTPEKPVGTVWLAWQREGREIRTRRERIHGDREKVRYEAVIIALEGMLELLG
jgi:nicotinamide-nucleotide amidase